MILLKQTKLSAESQSNRDDLIIQGGMEASLSFLSMYVQTYSTHLHPYIPRDHHPLRL
jgi:hypothetical protein